MKINGRERHFELNVQAHNEIAAQLPGNDFGKLNEAYTDGSLKTVETDIMVAIALNRGYEDHRHYEDPSYEPVYLTPDDFRFLPVDAIQTLEQELLAVLRADQTQEIETEPVRSKKAEEVAE